MGLQSFFRKKAGPSGPYFTGAEIAEYDALKRLHSQLHQMSNLLINGFSGEFPNNKENCSVDNCFHFRGEKFAIKISVGPWPVASK